MMTLTTAEGLMKYNILSVVNGNNLGECLVLGNPVVLEYERFGNVIIGTDGTFFNSYFYERPTKGFVAFAGRKFDIPLKDGSVIQCTGQWWDGLTNSGVNVLRDKYGFDVENIVYQTLNDIQSLQRCYVFFGYKTDKRKKSQLRKQYHGKCYEYQDFNKRIRFLRCAKCPMETGSKGKLRCHKWAISTEYVHRCDLFSLKKL